MKIPVPSSGAKLEEGSQIQAEELKGRLAHLLSLLLLVGGTLGWTTVGAVGRFEPAHFQMFLALSGVGLLAFLVRLRHPRSARPLRQ